MKNQVMLFALLAALSAPFSASAKDYFTCDETYNNEQFIKAKFAIDQVKSNGKYYYTRSKVSCQYTNNVNENENYMEPYTTNTNAYQWEYQQEYTGDIRTYDPNVNEKEWIAICESDNPEDCPFKNFKN